MYECISLNFLTCMLPIILPTVCIEGHIGYALGIKLLIGNKMF